MNRIFQKQVVFIGGVQGAGKTSLCEALKREHSCHSVKQRQALIKTGQKYGLKWEEVAALHDEFITEAAESVAREFLDDSNSEILLVDCHYAIRANKALRLKEKIAASSYIQDIDDRFINRLGLDFRIRFVLIDVLPSIAVTRFGERPIEFLDYDNTLEGLHLQRQAEQEKYTNIAKRLKVSDQDLLRISNNCEFENMVNGVNQFIAYSSLISRNVLLV